MVDFNKILEWITLIITKITGVLLWIATLIAEKAGLEVNNIHLILVLALSLYLASKITIERGTKLLFIAAIIFGAFYYFGGLSI